MINPVKANRIELKVLITGSSGLLGSKLCMLFKKDHEVIPTHHIKARFPGSIEMDVVDKPEVFRVLKSLNPDIVIHAAAETSVDRCEIDRDHAWRVNVEGTKNIAEACNEIKAKLVYISTDYVFDGEKGLYEESDLPNPVNYYGFTKLKGEEVVMKYCKDYIIARSSVLYGWHDYKLNFLTWVMNSLKEGREIHVVYDHFNSPTLVDNLAEAILEMIEKDLQGIYHVAGRERISRYEFASRIAHFFNLEPSLIKPVKMDSLKEWVAKRPRDSSLCVKKAQHILKTKLLTINEGLSRLREKIEGYNSSRRKRN